MPKGNPSIDMKRDESRTMSRKMDARATYAGRGRNHALAIEGAREMRVLENEHRITVANMTKEQREMKKKMLYLKSLLDESRQRKQPSTSPKQGSTPERSDDTENTIEKLKQPATVKKREYSFEPEVGRKDLKKLEMSKKAKDLYLSRTLHELQSSFTSHREPSTLSEMRLQRMKEDIRKMGKDKNEIRKSFPRDKLFIKKNDGKEETNRSLFDERSSEEKDTNKVIVYTGYSPHGDEGKDNVFLTKGHLPTHSLNFPEIPITPRKSGRRRSLPKRTSLSQLISSGHFTTLPIIQDHRQVKSSPAGHDDENEDNVDPPTEDGNQNTDSPDQLNRKSLSKKESALRKHTFVPLIGPPVPYYQPIAEENPFLIPSFKPKISRSRDLLESRKDNEMYVWLGFETESEFLEHQRLAKANQRKKKSVAGDTIEEEEDKPMSDHDGGDESEDEVDMELKDSLARGRSFARKPSKLGKPVTLSAGFRQRSNPFYRVANAVLIVRQFQMNVKS